ncbi:MAG: hypothetical protein AB1427_02050 [Thermodesulfobacteriota bacterium]
MHKMRMALSVVVIFLGSVLLDADAAMATQAHGAPEGIYAHQMAHLFFIFSMGILIYWLRIRKLVKETGWRFIQYSALFFILWNIDTFVVHLLDEQFGILSVDYPDFWHIRIQPHGNLNGMELLYYLAKLDHLLCVPALLFLYSGLKRLLKETGVKANGVEAQ